MNTVETTHSGTSLPTTNTYTTENNTCPYKLPCGYCSFMRGPCINYFGHPGKYEITCQMQTNSGASTNECHS